MRDDERNLCKEVPPSVRNIDVYFYDQDGFLLAECRELFRTSTGKLEYCKLPPTIESSSLEACEDDPHLWG